MDKNIDFKTISEPNKSYSKRFLAKMVQRNHIERIRRSNTNEIFLKKIIHRIAESGQARQIIRLNTSFGNSSDRNDINEENRWMIPHSNHGKCRVFLNVIDIINDLLKIINQINIYQNKTIYQFNRQKQNLNSNKNYYLDKLKDSGIFKLYLGELLNLVQNQNNSFQKIITDFCDGVDVYIKNMENEVNNMDQNVWDKWKIKLTERILKMGGKGLERFLQNLIDVIKTLIKPRGSNSSLFSKFEKHNSENLLDIVKVNILINRV